MQSLKIKLVTMMLGVMLILPGIAMVSQAINQSVAEVENNSTEIATPDQNATPHGKGGNGGGYSWS